MDGVDAMPPPRDAVVVAEPVDEDARLSLVRAGVRNGTIVPSIRGVQAVARCGAPMVRRYLAQLEAEGVIRRDGKGFVRV
jgi:DNA-binding transcriptional regulator YhcF (GntR family)